MALNKKPKGEEGAPLWMVTYGDMMSLLLTFFIMLVAMSEVKDDQKFRKVLAAVKQAFGYQGGVGAIISTDAPENSLISRLDEITLQNFKLKAGNALDEGVEGRENTVKRIREGIEFTIGGAIGFQFGSAELRPEARTALAEVTTYLRGENNKIEIRGHTTRAEVGPDKPFADEHELAFARATAVANYLAELGIRTDRLRRVTCGSSEPLIQRAYDEQSKAANRRVEIIVNQSLVQEFYGGEHESTPPAPVQPPGEPAEPTPPPPAPEPPPGQSADTQEGR
jgi:chemotaxis protein MotB